MLAVLPHVAGGGVCKEILPAAAGVVLGAPANLNYCEFLFLKVGKTKYMTFSFHCLAKPAPALAMKNSVSTCEGTEANGFLLQKCRKFDFFFRSILELGKNRAAERLARKLLSEQHFFLVKFFIKVFFSRLYLVSPELPQALDQKYVGAEEYPAQFGQQLQF